MKRYEDFVGLTEVKAAQARVVEAEKRFINTQELRRESQANLTDIQKKIKDIHLELEKTHRGEDRYLVLVTQEHQFLKDEKQNQEEFKQFEKTERECFSALSNAVRDSHEKERAQAEKTKYWSVIGSVIGTCLGIFGTTINNRMRMNELRRLVSQNNSVEEIRELGDQMKTEFTEHRTKLSDLVTEVTNVIESTSEGLGRVERVGDIVHSLEDSSQRFSLGTIDDIVTKVEQKQQELGNEFEDFKTVQLGAFSQLKQEIIGQASELEKDYEASLNENLKIFNKSNEKLSCQIKDLKETISNNNSLENLMLSLAQDFDLKLTELSSLVSAEMRAPKMDSHKFTEIIDKSNAIQSQMTRASFEDLSKKLSKYNNIRQETLASLSDKLNSISVEEQGIQTNQNLLLPHFVEVVDYQQRQTQKTVLASAVIVTILTPCILFLGNKLL